MNLIVLSSKDFPSDFYITHIRNRKNRLAIKPVIDISKQRNVEYILSPWLLFVAFRRWYDSIMAGYLPYKDEYINISLKNKLIEIRQNHNNEFEKRLREIVKKKTPYCEQNIKDNDRCFNGLSEKCPGEIDILTIFNEKKLVYLIDAKDYQLSRMPRDMNNELEKYINKNGFFDKMQNKKAFVERNLKSILSYYKIYESSENWKIDCIVVTAQSSIVFDNYNISVLTVSQFEKLIKML